MPPGQHPNSLKNLTPGKKKVPLTEARALEIEARKAIARAKNVKLGSARETLDELGVDLIREIAAVAQHPEASRALKLRAWALLLPYVYAPQRPVDRDGNAATPLLFIMPGAQAPATTVVDITPEELDGNEPETED